MHAPQWWLRVCCLLAFTGPFALQAQPGPPSFCFVVAVDADSLQPIASPIAVVQHFRERVEYVGWNGTWLRPPATIVLTSGSYLRDSTEPWTLFRPLGGKADSYVVIRIGVDSMRIALPEHEQELWERAMSRSGSRDSPEVIRFRKGDHRMADLIVDQWAVDAANVLNARYVQEEQQAYKARLAEQEAGRQAPAVATGPPPAPRKPRKRVNERATRMAGIKRIEVEHVQGDTLRLRVSGGVMLDGGCASHMPMFGIEMLTDTGWVERVPVALIQMDCGSPWADWQEREVMLPPLRWWVAAHEPPGRKELAPGHYRLVLLGADLVPLRTRSFELGH